MKNLFFCIEEKNKKDCHHQFYQMYLKKTQLSPKHILLDG